ncbi:MAG: phytanoyl-CoA dioxygenase family protein [Mycobacteriales bacterium]
MRYPTATEHHLSHRELSNFDRDGFLLLRQRIEPALLARLSNAADDWIGQGMKHGAAAGVPDFHWAARPAAPALFRVDYLHSKGRPESLELLGSPAVLGIAASLAGNDFVPTYESLVFKAAGDGAPIPWHQDAVHLRSQRIVNIDVYLDASLPGQGALRVLPGSQRRRADVCAIRDEHGWDPPGQIEVAMEPGDILLHDVMLVHGSPPAIGNQLRRTLYFEFRPADQIRSEGPWDDEWVVRRMRLIPLAQRAFAAAFPAATPFHWQPSPWLRPAPLADDAVELRVAHEVHSPGSFCSAGDSTGEASIRRMA